MARIYFRKNASEYLLIRAIRVVRVKNLRDNFTRFSKVESSQRDLKFIGPYCFNAKGAEVLAEDAQARLAEFALRPLRKPSRPLRLSIPTDCFTELNRILTSLW